MFTDFHAPKLITLDMTTFSTKYFFHELQNQCKEMRHERQASMSDDRAQLLHRALLLEKTEQMLENWPVSYGPTNPCKEPKNNTTQNAQCKDTNTPSTDNDQNAGKSR